MIEYYKEPGITPLEFINTVKKEFPDKKICYTARLDPMARGLIPILFGEDCKLMNLYTCLSKTYEVKVIIGLATDTDDALGIITQNTLNTSNQNISINQTTSFNQNTSHYILSNYKSIFEIDNELTLNQKYHYYSTKTLLSRSKKNFNNHYHSVKLYHSTIINSGELEFNMWKNECINTIDKVDKRKDYRQNEIIKQWNDLSKDVKEPLHYITLQLYVSSGFFIRQYIRDISEKIGIPLMCYDINRVNINY